MTLDLIYIYIYIPKAYRSFASVVDIYMYKVMQECYHQQYGFCLGVLGVYVRTRGGQKAQASRLPCDDHSLCFMSASLT